MTVLPSAFRLCDGLEMMFFGNGGHHEIDGNRCLAYTLPPLNPIVGHGRPRPRQLKRHGWPRKCRDCST